MAPRSTAAFPIFLPGSSSVSIRGRKVPSRRSVMPTIRAQASRRVKCEKAGPDHRGTPLNAQLATLFWPSLNASSIIPSSELRDDEIPRVFLVCANLHERGALCGERPPWRSAGRGRQQPARPRNVTGGGPHRAARRFRACTSRRRCFLASPQTAGLEQLKWPQRRA